jgi:foldase protein PrsA
MQGRYAPDLLRARASDKRIVVAAVLAVFLVAFFVVVAIAQGIGDPSVPSEDVAVVEDAPDGHIPLSEFQRSLTQTAASSGQKKVPDPSSPQYASLRDQTMSNLVLGRWVRGEAEDRGISLSDSEINNRLQQIKKQLGGEKGFQQTLQQAKLTPEEARQQVELQLLGNQIQSQVIPQDSPPSISDSQISDYYEFNKVQFEQPETRDVRQIVNKDEAKVQQAKSLLEKDDSPNNWEKAASQFSTDKATKATGGLRPGVAEGEDDPALESQIFSAPEKQLVGPFQVQDSFYLIQVDKITPAQTTPLDQASKQIEQQLAQGAQQQIAQDFQQDFTAKWTARTVCADDYLVQQCDNFTPPVQQAKGAPPVTSSPAVSPGQATVFPGQPAPALPQGPQQPPSAQSGVIGPGGAPLPPGAVPQGAAP